MTPELVTRNATLTVLGIDVVTSNADEANPASGKIPALWARFGADDVLSQVPGKKPPAMPVGVYTDYEGDQNGRYRLIAGAAVEDGTAVPKGLGQATVRPGQYLVFKGEGPLPAVVVQTWMSIWRYFADGSKHVRAYTTDFELYPGPAAVEIYVAVK